MKISVFFLCGYCAVIHAQEDFVVPQSLIDQVDQGNHEVAYFIGHSFMEGSGSVGKVDTERGMQWLEKAAQMGSAHAMHDLAQALHEDDKAEQALSWYQQAAALGYGESFESIAHFHYMGFGGLDKDCQEAYRWYEKAQAKGVELAYNNHAWYLSTSAEYHCRNPEKAVMVFSQLKQNYDSTEQMPWSFRDTESAVRAGISDFTAAIKLQEQLIEDVMSFDGDTSQFKVHLQQFQQRKPLIAEQ